MSQKVENQWRDKLQTSIAFFFKHTEIIKLNVGAFSEIGLPDLYVSQRELGGVWLELKYVPPGEELDWRRQPTALQKERLRALYYAGSRVGVLVFFDEFWVSIHGSQLIIAMDSEDKWDSSWAWASRYVHREGTADQLKSLVWG